MNLTITSTPSPSAAASAEAIAPGQAPVVPATAGGAAEGDAALAGMPAGLAPGSFDVLLELSASAPPPAALIQQFGQWLGQAEQAADAAPVDAATVALTEDAAARDPQAAEAAPVPELPLMGAMAMPVMPLAQAAQATLAAVAAALPGAPLLADPESSQASAAAMPSATGSTSAQPLAGPVAGLAQALFDSAAQPAAQAAAQPGAQAAAQPATPGLALPRLDVAAPDAAAKPAAAAALAAASAGFAQAMGEAAAEAPAAAATERGAAVATAGVAAPTVSAAAADSVTLAGPPTAWRQNLREALGERLQLQVGRGAEQAVIRLDPPNLGQVEIAIRHSAGTLEVTISASHREVVRQLQAVSENLRSDLAQRQFTDVAVNVTPTRAGAQSSPQFADGQGRGRQQDGGQEDKTPGQALAEAHQDGAFSLAARH